jgi:hypothetical protein
MAKKKKVKEPDRVLIPGRPDLDRCDNKVVSARYTAVTFLPVVRTENGVPISMTLRLRHER